MASNGASLRRSVTPAPQEKLRFLHIHGMTDCPPHRCWDAITVVCSRKPARIRQEPLKRLSSKGETCGRTCSVQHSNSPSVLTTGSANPVARAGREHHHHHTAHGADGRAHRRIGARTQSRSLKDRRLDQTPVLFFSSREQRKGLPMMWNTAASC